MCPIVVPSWPTQGLTASPRTPYYRQPLPLLNAEYCIKLHHDYSSNRFFETSMTIPTTLVLSSCSQKFASLFAARSSLTRHWALTFLRLRFCSHSINGMLDPKSNSHFIIYPRRDNTSFLQTSPFCFIYSDLPMSSLFIRIEKNEWMNANEASCNDMSCTLRTFVSKNVLIDVRFPCCCLHHYVIVLCVFRSQ